MKFQSYFNAPLEGMSNVCDMTREFSVNCVGAVDDTISFNNSDIRRDYYMMYVIKGSMDIQFDDYEGAICAGDLLIMRPGTIYCYSSVKGSGLNYLWLHFTGFNAEKIIEDIAIPLNKICHCGNIVSVIESWKRMCTEFIINDEHFEKTTASIFNEISIAFSRAINNKREKNRLLNSITYIHENYQQKINMEHLASMENLSLSHYRALFTQMFGESPVEYIISRRIEAAIQMLENSDKTLSEISALSGFNDVYYFGRQFKRKIGVSPGRYRKNKN